MRELGRLAHQFSDRLVLTGSGFLPLPCLSMMLSGARSVSGGEVEVILDRRWAIERGPRCAKAGDVVVIPGRGALPDMQIDARGVPVPSDDRTVPREILSRLAAGCAWLGGPAVLAGTSESNGRAR